LATAAPPRPSADVMLAPSIPPTPLVRPSNRARAALPAPSSSTAQISTAAPDDGAGSAAVLICAALVAAVASFLLATLLSRELGRWLVGARRRLGAGRPATVLDVGGPDREVPRAAPRPLGPHQTVGDQPAQRLRDLRRPRAERAVDVLGPAPRVVGD